jgi:hypothetical protein
MNGESWLIRPAPVLTPILHPLLELLVDKYLDRYFSISGQSFTHSRARAVRRPQRLFASHGSFWALPIFLASGSGLGLCFLAPGSCFLAFGSGLLVLPSAYAFWRLASALAF